MIKRIICVLIIIILALLPVCSIASTSVDLSHSCSLELEYVCDGIPLTDYSLSVYRVAQAFEDGTFEKIAPFDKYPVTIHGVTSSAEWKKTADTLYSYLTADSVSPYKTAKTNLEGVVRFDSLETGLYLVGAVRVESETSVYSFDSVMVYLPTMQDGTYTYDMSAKPKPAKSDITVPEIEYKVVKLWKDANSSSRPTSVDVDILKDGAVHKSVTLNSENNWSYTWTASGGDWSVVEKNVSDNYNVSISKNGTSFAITNTLPQDPVDKIPSTGDTAPLWLYVVIMCLSGLVLVILGVISAKNRKK